MNEIPQSLVSERTDFIQGEKVFQKLEYIFVRRLGVIHQEMSEFKYLAWYLIKPCFLRLVLKLRPKFKTNRLTKGLLNTSMSKSIYISWKVLINLTLNHLLPMITVIEHNHLLRLYTLLFLTQKKFLFTCLFNLPSSFEWHTSLRSDISWSSLLNILTKRSIL